MTALPPLPDPGLLADLCREVAEVEGVQPQLVEKDFQLTRLLWALGERLGGDLLLKGGTLLSKVDLGFFRMSEDADLVIPGKPSRSGGTNARRIEGVRDALRDLRAVLGCTIALPGGERFERNAHVMWRLDYPSEFGAQAIKVEVSIRPLLSASRKVSLGQLLADELFGAYGPATCWALSAEEARAEKVRAAFTRNAIRDFYDLDRLADLGADFTSGHFVRLVNAKLVELGALPLASQPAGFGVAGRRRERLAAMEQVDLPAVLRQGAPPFELGALLRRFDRLWGK